MSRSVHRLVYYSRNHVRGPLDGALRDILRASRRNNAHAGVSGALMFNAGCFAQVLEGPRAAIEHTFERIQQDERHGEVSLLSFGEVEGRAFETWSMAFVGGSKRDAGRFGDIAGDSGYDPSRMAGDALFATLHRLVLEEEATGAA